MEQHSKNEKKKKAFNQTLTQYLGNSEFKVGFLVFSSI